MRVWKGIWEDLNVLRFLSRNCTAASSGKIIQSTTRISFFSSSSVNAASPTSCRKLSAESAKVGFSSAILDPSLAIGFSVSILGHDKQEMIHQVYGKEAGIRLEGKIFKRSKTRYGTMSIGLKSFGAPDHYPHSPWGSGSSGELRQSIVGPDGAYVSTNTYFFNDLRFCV